MVSISFNGHRYLSDCYFGIPKTIRFNGLFEKTHNLCRDLPSTIFGDYYFYAPED